MKLESTYLSNMSRRRGVTLADVCVVLAIALLLLVIIVPGSANMASQSNRVKCASNLRQIALACIMYASQETRNNGKFSRTYFDPALADQPALYTGIDTVNAFADQPAGGPKPNDVTAAFFNVLKRTDITAEAFICPDSDAVPLDKSFPIQNKSNFPGPQNLSYSYANPYPTEAAIMSGWKLDFTLPPDYPLVADINPGDSSEGGPTTVAYTDPQEKMIWANSPNHHFEGQQVVYVDGHVEWQTTPFSGAPRSGQPYRDNLYAADIAGASPADGKGGVILGGPKVLGDNVLLPTATDTAAGATLTLAARVPGQTPPAERNMMLIMIGGGLVVLAVAAVVLVVSMRKKPQPVYAQPMGQQPPQPPPDA